MELLPVLDIIEEVEAVEAQEKTYTIDHTDLTGSSTDPIDIFINKPTNGKKKSGIKSKHPLMNYHQHRKRMKNMKKLKKYRQSSRKKHRQLNPKKRPKKSQHQHQLK